MKHKILPLFALILTVLLAVGCAFSNPPDTPEARTKQILKDFGIKKAVDLGLQPDRVDPEVQCHVYTDKSGGMTLCFEPETGRLKRMENLAALEAEDREPVFDSEEEQQACALEWAEKALADACFGELELTNVGANSYVFSEFYDGIPTDTAAMVSFVDNGELLSVSAYYGDLFQRDDRGQYSLRRGDDLIGEAAAIAAAKQAFAQCPEAEGFTYSQEPTVKLSTYRHRLCYEVKIITDRTEAWARDFTIWVDAYDPAGIEIAYSK